MVMNFWVAAEIREETPPFCSQIPGEGGCDCRRLLDVYAGVASGDKRIGSSKRVN